jgi:sigma-E factor negative regulatory protein RseA
MIMVVKQQELLSAFVDGELSSEELDQLLAMLDKDEQVRNELLRYQHQSDVMRGYTNGQPMIDISQKVSAVIVNEQPQQLNTKLKSKAKLIQVPSWLWRQTAGLAVAASLGAFAVLSVVGMPSTSTPTTVVAESSEMQQSPNRWTVGEAEVEDRLNSYLVEHNHYAGNNGMFSYARVVSYGDE